MANLTLYCHSVYSYSISVTVSVYTFLLFSKMWWQNLINNSSIWNTNEDRRQYYSKPSYIQENDVISAGKSCVSVNLTNGFYSNNIMYEGSQTGDHLSNTHSSEK
jgi:hypothetical protein